MHFSRFAAGAGLSIVLAITVATISTLAAAAIGGLTPVNSRKPAPSVTLKDQSGKAMKLSDFNGKVVLLDFWATWCAGCKVEIPWFIEFEQKYRSRGLSAIGVALDEEGWRTVKPYLSEHPISYPIVLGDMDLLEKKFKLALSLPQTLLIDRNGRIAATHVGVVNKELFERDLQQLLGEPAR
jgi:cytochrome c biogenesis protein CcmG/thiol:disulfide interchange protein DsbE